MSATASPDLAFTAHTPQSRDFMVNAACRSANPTTQNIRDRAELFFPGRSPGPGSETKMRRASAAGKTICQSCTVTKECENYRNSLDIPFGTWGGIAQNEREHGGRA
jgi:hypothetical protein